MTLAVNNENFEAEVVNSDKPVLLDFWADWCPPCKMVKPIIESLAEEYKDKIKVAKVDVDAEKELAERFNISSIPTMIVFNNGEMVKQQVGAIPKPAIIKLFEEFIS